VWGMGAGRRHQTEWLSWGLESQAEFLAWRVRRGMETARLRRMASLRLGPVAGGRVWLSDLQSYRLSGSGVDRGMGVGFVWVQSGRGRTRRGGRLSAALGLWDRLPSVSRVLV
jgi:hypothetical protein